MNLSKALDTTTGANEGAVLELRGADGAVLMKDDGVTPVTIRVLGKDSDAWVKHENAVQNRRLQAGTRVKLTAEALKSEGIQGLAKITTGWDGIGIDEDETEFSLQAAVLLYTRYPDIREQVDTFFADRSNFLQASPKS